MYIDISLIKYIYIHLVQSGALEWVFKCTQVKIAHATLGAKLITRERGEPAASRPGTPENPAQNPTAQDEQPPAGPEPQNPNRTAASRTRTPAPQKQPSCLERTYTPTYCCWGKTKSAFVYACGVRTCVARVSVRSQCKFAT